MTGRFVKREKRFFVAAQIGPDPAELVWAHTNNTGSMLGLARPGAPVLLSPADKPGRKLRWTLEYIRAGWTRAVAPGRQGDGVGDGAAEGGFPEIGPGAAGGFWVGVNTAAPNRLLEAAFRAGRLPWARGYTRLTREKTRGESRIDALLEGPGLPELWVECKNVTLVEDGAALFPDAVSARGGKHLRALADIVRNGGRAAMFYLVQRPDARCFAPADCIDPAYAEAFAEALAAGVEIYPHEALLSPAGIDLREPCLRLAGETRFPSEIA